MGFCFGKQPAVYDSRLPMAHGLMARAPAPLPPSTNWRFACPTVPMLGNDRAGNCAFAASLHYVDIVSSNAGQPNIPDAQSALDDYALYTGFDPATGANDHGTVVLEKNKRWMASGLAIRAGGSWDKLDGFAQIEAGDLATLREVIATFQGAELGLSLPANACPTFAARRPWVDTTQPGQDGHDVIAVDYDGEDWFIIATWNGFQRASSAWVAKYMDEGTALLRRSVLARNGLSASGLTMQQLDEHIAELGGVLGLGAT